MFFVVYSVSRSKEDVGGMEEGWEVVCVGELGGGGGMVVGRCGAAPHSPDSRLTRSVL